MTNLLWSADGGAPIPPGAGMREKARRRRSRARDDLDDSTDGRGAVGPEHRVT